MVSHQEQSSGREPPAQNVRPNEFAPERFSLFSWAYKYVMFDYFFPYMKLTRNIETAQELQVNNLPKLWSADDTSEWHKKYPEHFDRRATSSNHVFFTILKGFWRSFLGLYLTRILLVLMGLGSIYCFKKILYWQEIDTSKVTSAERIDGILSVLGIILLEGLEIFGSVHWAFWFQRVSLRIQGVLTSSLYRNILQSGFTEGHSQNPKLQNPYNLLTIDIPTIPNFFYSIVALLILPFNVIFSFTLLFYQVGFSSYVGLQTLLTIVVIIVALELYCGYLKPSLLKAKDMRLNRSHDALCSLKTVKMLKWEDVSIRHINEIREQEMSYRKRRIYVDLIATSFVVAAYAFTQLAVISSYVSWSVFRTGTNYVMKASVVLPVLQIINRLAGPLTDLPFTLNSLVEGYTSINRYQIFVSAKTSKTQSTLCQSEKTFFTNDSSSTKISSEPNISSEESYTLVMDPLESPSLKIEKSEVDERSPLLTDYDNKAAKRSNDSTHFTQNVSNSQAEEPLDIDNENGTLLLSMECILFIWNYLHSLQNDSLSPLRSTRIDELFNIKCPEGTELDLLQKNSKVTQQLEQMVDANLKAFELFIPTLNIRTNECLLLTGPPASGKTSLLLALLGEMPKVCGQYVTYANYSISYASQVPWIPEGIIRHIILFGQSYDAKRYHKVIQACQLYEDFNSWPEKDMTWVFEGAERLSTGQKSRVCLARALYYHLSNSRNSSIQQKVLVLLDDPFSTIDPHLGLTIFENLFKERTGLLCHASTILVIDSVNLAFFNQHYIKSLGNNSTVTFRHMTLHNGKLHVTDDFDYEFSTNIANVKNETSVDHCELATKLSVEPKAIKKEKETPLSRTNPEVTTLPKETSHIGEVHRETYVWFLHFLSKKTLAACVFFILIVAFFGLGSELWLVHWTSYNPLSLQSEASLASAKSSQNSSQSATGSLNAPSFQKAYDTKESSNSDQMQAAKLPSISSVLNLKSEDPEQSALKNGPLSQLKGQINSYFSSDTTLEDLQKRDTQYTFYALIVFICLSSIYITAVFAVNILEASASLKISRSIHWNFFESLMKAPIWLSSAFSFGAIVNRFSGDMEVVDGSLPLIQMSVLLGSIVYLSAISLTLCIITPWVVPFIPILVFIFYQYVYLYYRPACREFQRVKLRTLTPLCSNISEAETGITIIRAFRAEEACIEQNNILIQNMIRSYFARMGSSQWANLRLQLYSAPFALANMIIPIALNLFGLNYHSKWFQASQAGLVGIAMSLAFALPNSLSSIIQKVTVLEQQMCSVQRLNEIEEYKKESDLRERLNSGKHIHDIYSSFQQLPKFCRTKDYQEGVIFNSITVSYQRLVNTFGYIPKKTDQEAAKKSGILLNSQNKLFENLPPALVDFKAYVRKGERIGIVGRSGAGKSTIFLTLLNMTEIMKGAVYIHGLDIKSKEYAEEASFIGVLTHHIQFRGWTIKQHLDPMNEFTDQQIIKSLKQFGLYNLIFSFPDGLNTVLVKDSFIDTNESNQKESSHHQGYSSSNNAACVPHLTCSQMRLLGVVRLSLHADRYKVILIDEAPIENQVPMDLMTSETSDSKHHISQLIMESFPHCTIFCIAHYALSLKNCDRVWVINQGRLVKEISPKEMQSQKDLIEAIQT